MEKVRLGDICEIVSGSTPKTNIREYWDGVLDWITPAEIDDNTYIVKNSERKITEDGVKNAGLKPFPRGTVILSSRAPIGKVAIAGKEMYCNQGFKNLICSDKIYNKFLFWYLKSKKDFLNEMGHGATFKELSKKMVADIEINLPDKKRQEEVVEALEKLDQIIKSRKQQVYIMNTLIKARFVEMFGVPGFDNYDWELVELGNTCHINPKKGQDARLTKNMEVSFVPMSAVTEDGKIDVSAVKKYDEVKSGFTYFAENDVLFAKITPCMENGKGAIAKGLYNGIGFGSTEFHVLRPISGKTNPYWLYMLTTFSQFRVTASKNMTGSAGQRRVPASFLENYRVAVPPIELQEQFAAFVAQVDKSKSAIQKKHIYKSKNAWERKMSILSIIISVIALFISVWNSFIAHRLKHVEANMVWDDLFSTFCILIRNIGKRTVVIKCIKLIAYDSKTDIELGRRDNCWMIKQQKAYIEANEVMTIYPIHQSIYDIFAYWMQGKIELEEKYKKMSIKLIVYDIDNKNWEFVTPFTWGEIHEKLEYAVTIE